MAETIGVNLVGSSAGFVSAIEQATSSLKAFEKRAESMGAVGSLLRSTLLPAASAVAAAFSASKALGVFADSDLPGAKAYKDALTESKKAVTALGAAVGEFLAPAAIRVSKIIVSISETLTPFVRKFTAFTSSAAGFLMKLAQNAADALRFVMPTLDAIIKSIEGLFGGPARKWEEDLKAFRAWWNNTWNSILTYTAPIIAAAASAIDQALITIGEIAQEAFQLASDTLAPFLENVDQGAGTMEKLAAVVQGSLVTAFNAAEFAIANWRTGLDIAWTSIKLGVSILKDFGSVTLGNAMKALNWFGTEAKNLFSAIFGKDGYIVNLLTELFGNYLPTLVQTSTAAMRNRIVAAMPGGEALFGANANAPFAPFGFKEPAFNWKANAFPAMQGLGGGDKGLGIDLSLLTSAFTRSLTDFTQNAGLRAIIEGWFVADKLKAGLPNVDANVAAAIDKPASDKRAGLFLEGSREAYQAILKAQGMQEKTAVEVAKEQLAEARRQGKVLDEQKKAIDKISNKKILAGRL